MFQLGQLTVVPEKNQIFGEADLSILLSRRSMDLLVYFSKHSNEVISNDQLMKEVWINRVVSDSAVYKAISEIRTAIGDTHRPYRFLKTVPKRGYEFLVEVVELVKEIPRILVFPFKSEDEGSLILNYGLTEDIVAGLSTSKWLMVFDSGTSFSFSGTDLEPRMAAKQLKAAYVVHGRLRRIKDRLRASFYLTEVGSGKTLWTQQFDRRADEVFDMEDEIKHHLLAVVEPEYLRNEEQNVRSRNNNLEGWECIVKARQLFWQIAPKANLAAREIVEKIIVGEEPDARAWGILAMTHLSDVLNGWSDSIVQSLALADRASLEALKIDEMTRSAVIGTMGDLAQAEADLERALDLNHNFASALGDMARIKVFSGNTSGAEDFALRAMALSPRDPHFSLWCYWIALYHFVEGRYEEALPWLDKGNTIRPDWLIFKRLKAVCLVYLDKKDLIVQIMSDIDVVIDETFHKVLKAHHPFAHKEPLQRYILGLEKAISIVAIQAAT